MDKEYTEPIDITIDGNVVTWVPGESLLRATKGENAEQIVTTVSDFILNLSPLGKSIEVTPEGPFLPATAANIYTVVWAIDAIYGDDSEISYGSDAPTLADLGLDEDSDFDKYGKPLVR